jgi:hypothetical protein
VTGDHAFGGYSFWRDLWDLFTSSSRRVRPATESAMAQGAPKIAARREPSFDTFDWDDRDERHLGPDWPKIGPYASPGYFMASPDGDVEIGVDG